MSADREALERLRILVVEAATQGARGDRGVDRLAALYEESDHLIDSIAVEVALEADNERLREALTNARKDVVEINSEGWDSTRGDLAWAAIQRIDAALAVEPPTLTEGEA